MRNIIFSLLGLLLLGMACAAPALDGEVTPPPPLGAVVQATQDTDGEWDATRREILLGDLQIAVGLSSEQLEALKRLSVAHKERIVAVMQEIGAMAKQVRELARDWQTNFQQICHLQFQIFVKEFQLGQGKQAFSEAVDAVLTSAQGPKKPLVMRTLDEAYHFTPPPPRPENAEEGRGVNQG